MTTALMLFSSTFLFLYMSVSMFNFHVDIKRMLYVMNSKTYSRPQKQPLDKKTKQFPTQGQLMFLKL